MVISRLFASVCIFISPPFNLPWKKKALSSVLLMTFFIFDCHEFLKALANKIAFPDPLLSRVALITIF